MGDPSKLRLVPASSAATPIDWTRVPEATKKLFIKLYGYDWEKKEYRPLPATIGDLAKMFDETKFFGYFNSNLLNILMDISEFGLQPTPPTRGQRQPVGPRFYMRYLNEMWLLIFAPGTRDGIVGNSDCITRNILDDDDYNVADGDGADDSDEDNDEAAWEKMACEEEEKVAAKERAIAQAFDDKLEHEFSLRRELMVDITKKLGGWTASSLQSSLEEAQFAGAIMSLPISHPAHKGFMKNFFESLSSR